MVNKNMADINVAKIDWFIVAMQGFPIRIIH